MKANNLIVFVEYFLISHNAFQSFLDVLLNFAPKNIARIEVPFKFEVMCKHASGFFFPSFSFLRNVTIYLHQNLPPNLLKHEKK